MIGSAKRALICDTLILTMAINSRAGRVLTIARLLHHRYFGPFPDLHFDFHTWGRFRSIRKRPLKCNGTVKGSMVRTRARN